ncbi:hypothetical protein [Parasitella parasitica]|uniref:Tc1-like transposase DDE domain-containing protein n=1 Tax=Parasitella parasitica TaxID=35722 RepID=A0A0B7NTJ5_9FUNG|nr:hypothetical protein [Parasitella parasitica]
MNFFHQDGRDSILDESGQEASAFVVESSFRLKKLTNLHEYVKNKPVAVEVEEPKDTEMTEAAPKKERTSAYNIYSDEDRRRYFYFIQQKLINPSEAAKAANVNYETARKWKTAYNKDPEKNIPLKKTNRTPNSKPDAVEDLIQSFEGLDKKSRVAEFMKEECNLSIKVITRHPVARNSKETLDARTQFVKEWIQEKRMLYMQNCVFLDESGFDINMRRSRAWSARGTQAVRESPSARAVSHTVIGAVSAFGVVVGAKKRKAPGDNGSAIPKGTTSGHYHPFISDTLEIMDKFPNMKGCHIVMDNGLIYSHDIAGPVIVERGYIPVYLPPYSPMLNPIEMF